MAELEFTIPGKGKPKGRAKRATKDGHAYIPTPTRNAEALVKMMASAALGRRPMLRGALRLTLVAVFPIPTTWPAWQRALAASGELMPTVIPDWDNIGKLVSDALNQIAYIDDKAICKTFLEKRYGERAETFVHIAELYSAELLERLERKGRPAEKPSRVREAA